MHFPTLRVSVRVRVRVSAAMLLKVMVDFV